MKGGARTTGGDDAGAQPDAARLRQRRAERPAAGG